MVISADKFYENIGTVIFVPEDILGWYSEEESFILLPKGTYVIVDREDTTDSDIYALYDIKNYKNVTLELGWLPEDYKFTTIYTEPLEVLNFSVESMVKKIQTLLSEGWDVDKPYFDLNPYIRKLDVLSTLKRMLESGKKNANTV
jgi:hypothetical protein